MKELSIEEKVRRYDEAISKAKEWHSDVQIGIGFKANLEKLFPELKESEDEKIRKELLNHLKEASYGKTLVVSTLDYKRWADWLEKQGDKDEEILILKDQIKSLHAAIKAIKETHRIELEKQGKPTYNKELSELLHKVICKFINDPDIPYSDREKVSMKVLPYVELLEKQGEHVNFLNKIQVGDKVTRNQDGVLVNLSQLKRVAKPAEIQGEQKPAEEYNITGIGSKHAQGKLGEMIKNQNPVNEVLEQNHADKVEPKFKVGDVVTNKKSKDTVKIVQILHDSYCYSGWDGAATVHSDFSISEQDDWELVQQTPAWSEEDKCMLNNVVDTLKPLSQTTHSGYAINSMINWLKSLRPQNTWKPSDEQMVVLNDIIINGHMSNANERILKGLQEQLKKLRKE